MRDKNGLGARRRFRPGWMQDTENEGIDNPAMTLEPVVSASFSVGDPEDDRNTDVAITVTDTDNDRKDTSVV